LFNGPQKGKIDIKYALQQPPTIWGPSGGILKKSFKIITLIAVASMVTAVAVAPASMAAKSKIKACLALDTGGVDDKSFNASAWAGAQAAKGQADVSYLAATSDADYAPNIKKLVDSKCNIIVGVGFLINGAIVDAAKANPGTKFAIVDQDGMDHGPAGDQYPGKALPNLKGLTFATNQSAFQAGYLAAGFSMTGKVATYGGLNIPPVTIFMDGFARGVAYYNKIKSKSVVVYGWDTAKKDGTFVGGFSDQAKALQISKNFEQQGADVIFPVAGGLGGATANNSIASKKSVVIWVDSDGYKQVPQYKSVLLTSVMKGVGVSVTSVITDAAKGRFNNTTYLGTLANKGTGLAGYHQLASKVGAVLQREVRALGTAITAGTVDVTK
jgi:basic membrane protein A